MTQNVRIIFDMNIKLLGDIDKTIIYFREQYYEKALCMLANSVDLIKIVIEKIIADREYFNLVDTKSLLEMLTGILEAKKKKDLILLTDLLELQLVNFLIGVQELIMSKDEIVFNEDSYQDSLSLLQEHGEGFTDQLMKPINTLDLLQSGYCIEFTSCGQMTLAGENQGMKFYFHTNHKIQLESFLLARQWYHKDKTKYIIFGFGLGYHVHELSSIATEAEIEVFESDLNVLQLACAFADIHAILTTKKIKITFDPELILLKERLKTITEEEKVLIHYPSYRNLKTEQSKEILQEFLPWDKIIDEI